MLSIFVSHSSTDNEFGYKLVKDLRRELHNDEAVWYDTEGGLDAGDAWWGTIVEELTTRDVFLIVLSPDAMNSDWVLRELDIAVIERKHIIPLLYHACEMRADLKIRPNISFLPPKTYETALSELLTALQQPPQATVGQSHTTFDVPRSKEQSTDETDEEQARKDEKERLGVAREEQVEQPPEMRKGLDSGTQSRSGVVHPGVSRRTVVLGLGIAGLTVAGGGFTWLLSSRTFRSSTFLHSTPTPTPTSTPTPQPPKVIYILSDVTNNGKWTGEAVSAVRASDGTTLWHSQWNNEQSYTQPVVVDGVVYVPTTHFGSKGFADAGVVHALRASDGSTIWSYRVEHNTRAGASVYIANGVAFVVAPSNGYFAIFVLRASDGSLLWKYQGDMEDIALSQAVANGVVYTGSYDFRSSRGNAYAFRVSDGTMLWKYQMNLDVKGYAQSAVVDNGVVYIASPTSYNRFQYPYDPTKDVQNTNSTVYALRASDGSLLWQYEIDKDSSFLSLEMIDGVLYATSGSQKKSNGIIYALQAGNGSLLWKYQVHIDYRYYSGQIEAIITGGVVYIASQGNPAILSALRAKDGSLLWQYNLENGFDSIIVPANGIVYVGTSSDSSSIDALRVSDGSLLWRYRLNNGSYFSALVAARTTLYVGVFGSTGPGSLFTLQLNNGSLLRRSQGVSVRFMTGGS